MAGQDWLEKDFYQVLGIDKHADQKTIKKAYRKLARRYHPDQNKGNPRAEARFKQIGEAYQVLSHPEQRKQYDALRTMAGGGARFTAGPHGGATGFEDVFASMYGAGRGGNGSGASSANYRFYQSGAGGGLNDILSNIFGAGASPFASTSQRGSHFGFGSSAAQTPKGQDLAASTDLDFSQAVQGATLRLSIEGRVMTVRIPAGVHDGQKIRLRGKGRPSPHGGEAGDLVVTLHVRPHPVFSLKEKSLHMVLPISVDEAINGAKVTVPLLDGSHVQVKIPAGTSSDTILRVKGKGVPLKNKRGDLYIRTRIVVPHSSSLALRRAASHVADAQSGFDPREELAHYMQESA